MRSSTAIAVLPIAAQIAALALASGALASCRLIDQRTFEGTGVFPGAAQLHAADYAARAAPPPPLAIVRLGTPGVDWQTPLIAAARDAQVRRADVEFDLVTPIPSLATMSVQDRVARQGAADSAVVATALEGDDISPERIHLGLRGDRGQPPREVEVYVR
jgi:hypothetical protein